MTYSNGNGNQVTNALQGFLDNILKKQAQLSHCLCTENIPYMSLFKKIRMYVYKCAQTLHVYVFIL